ncbi:MULTISPECIES: hypothetical protein [Bacillus]|nr:MULTISPECIES: hypothetical protein [Bacillus]
MKKDQVLNNVELKLDVEVYEVSSATVLETMGASIGKNSCSVIVQQ